VGIHTFHLELGQYAVDRRPHLSQRWHPFRLPSSGSGIAPFPRSHGTCHHTARSMDRAVLLPPPAKYGVMPSVKLKLVARALVGALI
jgi:hypothetical protein